MVVRAAHAPPASPLPTLPASVINGRGGLVRFTVRDVRVLLEQGVLPEDASTELLDGLIVKKDRADRGEDPNVIGRRHRSCTEKLSQLRGRIDSADRHVQSQQPLICDDDHAPEPDFMVVRGTLDDYADRDVTAADAFCVVEVADSSYERDVGEKLLRYARAGVPQYIVIYLTNRRAEVYTNADQAAGTYPPPQVVAEGQTLSLRVGDTETFDVPLAGVLAC